MADFGIKLPIPLILIYMHSEVANSSKLQLLAV